MMVPKSIAVLGAGISGLSAAFHLTRRFPRTPIVILEKTGRVGGWIRSRRVDVVDSAQNSANICLETGPRTLRPDNLALLELINLLELSPALITTSRSSPAARNRFIFAPELGEGLKVLPSSPLSLLTKSVGRNFLVPAALRDLWRSGNRPEAASEDEAFEEILQRRFGDNFARIFGSAIVHGIYAADARKLSVRATFSMLREVEERGRGSILSGLLRRKNMSAASVPQYSLGNMLERMKGVSVYSFIDGIETIPRSLLSALKRCNTVTVKLDNEVRNIMPIEDSQEIKISTTSGEIITASHVVSSVPLSGLLSLVEPMKELSEMVKYGASSVIVVNIVFAPSSIPLHPPGFGYLIPRPAVGYTEENPGILGVVFDSCSLGSQDHGSGSFTKLTVMLGGPYPLNSSNINDKNILAQLSLQLGRELPEPVFMTRTVNHDCIPHVYVGHNARVDRLRKALSDKPWNGKMEVIGPSIGGVSVGNCVEAGRNSGQHWDSTSH